MEMILIIFKPPSMAGRSFSIASSSFSSMVSPSNPGLSSDTFNTRPSGLLVLARLDLSCLLTLVVSDCRTMKRQIIKKRPTPPRPIMMIAPTMPPCLYRSIKSGRSTMICMICPPKGMVGSTATWLKPEVAFSRSPGLGSPPG